MSGGRHLGNYNSPTACICLRYTCTVATPRRLIFFEERQLITVQTCIITAVLHCVFGKCNTLSTYMYVVSIAQGGESESTNMYVVRSQWLIVSKLRTLLFFISRIVTNLPRVRGEIPLLFFPRTFWYKNTLILYNADKRNAKKIP